MRSIFGKILLWAVGTVALSLVGFAATTLFLVPRFPPMRDLLARTQALEVDGARRALDEGGPDRLAAFLRRLDSIFDGEHHLVDAGGRDLVDGADRSPLLARASPPDRPPRPSGGRAVLASPGADGGPRLLVVLRLPFEPAAILPYYLWILLAVVGLGYALAVHLARPLRGLRRAVERFGRGDLSTRIGWPRRDEFGELARDFDVMAGRIETLMAAERRLLQDVSHELRSPLARLGFAIELARAGEDRDAALDRIKKDVDRLSALVGELLQLNRAEGDPAARDPRPVRLDDLVRDVVDDCTLELEAKGCRPALRTDGPALVRGEPELLRRAVENVVRNAARHAPEGTAVEVDLSRADGDATVVVTVRDRGEGVPAGSLDAIFEPFFRIGGDRSRSLGGVGLGLAIARRAILLHDGRISAANAHPGLSVSIALPTITP